MKRGNIMKNKMLFAAAAALVLAVGTAKASNIWDDPNGWRSGLFSAPTNGAFFNPQELQLDLFGSYDNPEPRLPKLFDSDIRHGAWGGGVGLNYFLSQNIGLGGDVNLADSQSARLVTHAVGDVL